MKLLSLLLPLATLFCASGALAADPGGRGAMAIQEPASGTPATDSYRLGPEDVIQVFVWKEPELTTSATVRPDGGITLPLVGEIHAAGATPEALRREITTRLRAFVDLPAVTVIVKEINSPKITVLGEVRRPGQHRVPQRVTVLDAIAMSGGFTEFADTDDVAILRQTPAGAERIPVDVKELLKHGGPPVYLEAHDVVYVD